MTLPVFPALRPPDMAGVQNGQLPGHMLVKVEMAGADARCHPEFARALRALIHDCKAATGADLTTIGHYRSLERQIELLKERYVRAPSGSRFWDGSWWRKVSGATVATPGTSDHGWGLAIDGAVWDARRGEAIGIAESAAWPFIRAHLTDYGLCWAWQDEDEEPWHWHLFQIGAPAVVGGGDPGTGGGGGPEFDPANRRYGQFPLIPNKEMLQPGSTGDAVRYLQGVCRHEVARFALWFWAQEPETLPDGQVNPRSCTAGGRRRVRPIGGRRPVRRGGGQSRGLRAVRLLADHVRRAPGRGARTGRPGRPGADVAVHRLARRRHLGGVIATGF